MIKMDRLSAHTAKESAIHTMAKRKTLSITRRASRPTSSRFLTMRSFCSKDGLAVAHTCMLEIRCAHAANAISTKCPSGSSK